MHEICYGFYLSIKKWFKLGQKTDFFTSLWGVFCVCSITPYELCPRFCELKDLIQIQFCGGSHKNRICGCEVQSFFYWFSIHEMATFWGFFSALYFPKYWSILLKWSDVVLKKTNTVFQKSFKLFNFGSNGKHPNFTVLVHFGAQFTARKPKILLKIRISTKITYRIRLYD